MSIEDRQKATTINVQEKANLIWEIATHLYGEYKPHEYGKVILPMTVIKRFDDALKDTKPAVVAKAKELDNPDRPVVEKARDAILKSVAKHDFYNTSKYDFSSLLADPDDIKENFKSYLQSFSDNVKDIIARFEFDIQIDKMSENDLLYTIINEFNSKKADFSPEVVSSQDMGYVFEELIRKFSESYDEQAGAHFTSRDIIYLMTEILILDDKEKLLNDGGSKTVYDMTMGTSQMLACLEERLEDINEDINVTCFGQEFNPETFAIAKADMLIKGGDADNMKFGDTLSNDQFSGYQFDYIISNPPFGIDWKKEKDSVLKESKMEDGRFEAGLPAISDGQMLFLQNGIKKLKDTGRMAIIQNGSSLFTGDAGSGASNIRKYLIEHDWLEAIIQLPTDLFYNTNISTYIWIVTKNKSNDRVDKIQLIDASKCSVNRRKNIGKKRVDLTKQCIDLILKAYQEFSNNVFEDKLANGNIISVESRIYNRSYFGYYKIPVITPLYDENKKPILKNNKPVIDKSIKDFEIVPFGIDLSSYFEKNVKPFNPDSWFDEKNSLIGYEIPFIKEFYKFTEPKNSAEIMDEISKLISEEAELIKELLKND